MGRKQFKLDSLSDEEGIFLKYTELFPFLATAYLSYKRSLLGKLKEIIIDDQISGKTVKIPCEDILVDNIEFETPEERRTFFKFLG
ncbi:MAG: hypothetical protein ACYCQJ_15740 [Nitrososphaerales archaeon]